MLPVESFVQAIGVTVLIRCLLVEWHLLRSSLGGKQVRVHIVLLLELEQIWVLSEHDVLFEHVRQNELFLETGLIERVDAKACVFCLSEALKF